MPRLRANRVPERAAVNVARTFFEANGCIFQEVSGDNDYGKDAYVDLTFGGQVTGLCAALQIKGGESYRRTAGGYVIPLDDDHAKLWRSSTVPIFGIVHDQSDGKLRWCNIRVSKLSRRRTAKRVDSSGIVSAIERGRTT